MDTNFSVLGRKCIFVDLSAIVSTYILFVEFFISRGRCRGHRRMVVGFTTTCAISAYHHTRCGLISRSWRDVLGTTLCDKTWQWLAAGPWYSPVTPVSSTSNTDDITENIVYHGVSILLWTKLYPRLCKLVLNDNPWIYSIDQ